jgi:hypothetical protein
MAGIRISSNNFNGKSVEITFNPFSGGTIDLGTQTIPYDYVSSNYEGDYSIYIPEYDKTCDLRVGVPPSPTPTSTPTPTPTPSATPAPIGDFIITQDGDILEAQNGDLIEWFEPTLDPDAAAYLADVVASGGTTNPTIEAAVDTLFTSLKNDGIYNKLFSFYPVIGGVAASHAINAKLNKSYDLAFTGGWTHNVSGMTSTDTSYADTNITPQNLGSAGTGLDNHHILISVTDVTKAGYEGAGPSPYLIQRLTCVDFFSAQSTITPGTQYTDVGIQILNRTANNSFHAQYQASGGTLTKSSVNTTTATSITTNNILISAVSATSFNNAGRYNFWTCGDGLTDTEVSNLFSHINTFNNSLSRRGW